MSKSLQAKCRKRSDLAGPDIDIQTITPADYDNPATAAETIAFDIHFHDNAISLFYHLANVHGMNERQYLLGLRYLVSNRV